MAVNVKCQNIGTLRHIINIRTSSCVGILGLGSLMEREREKFRICIPQGASASGAQTRSARGRLSTVV